MRKYQYQQYTTRQATIQPFKRVHFNKHKCKQQANNHNATTRTQEVRRAVFLLLQDRPRKNRMQGQQRDEANSIKEEDVIPMKKPADPNEPK